MRSFSLFRRVDAVYTLLAGFVHDEILQGAVTAYFHGNAARLDALSHTMMRDINSELVHRFKRSLSSELLKSPDHARRYETHRGNQSDAEARGLFDLLDEVLALPPEEETA